MSSHVRIGHAIVAAAELEEEARWVLHHLHHHEHLDGSGYPLGVRGELERLAGAQFDPACVEARRSSLALAIDTQVDAA
jgi:HD domain